MSGATRLLHIRRCKARDVFGVGMLILTSVDVEGGPFGEAAAELDERLAAIRPEWWSVDAALERRSVSGGSAPGSVRDQLAAAHARLEDRSSP